MNKVNAIGDACPLPVIKTKKALEAMAPGLLEVTVDNDVAVQNITRFATARNYPVTSEQRGDSFVLTIEKIATSENHDMLAGVGESIDHEASKLMADPSALSATPAMTGTLVVAIASDKMGAGDDALGDILMKSFFFTLTQLDELPDTILLYNTGAKLSVEGSAVLPDLIALEKAGVRLMTCGTCLNHFGIADRLTVGEITNMYDIVDQLKTAGHVIKP